MSGGRGWTLPFKWHRKGFTLVELLVVIAIIGVLVALLLPAVQAAREASRRAQCSNNLKQIGVACHMFHDAKKVFPIAAYEDDNQTWGWAVYLLPFIEQERLWDIFMQDAVLVGPNGSIYSSSGAAAFMPVTDMAAGKMASGGTIADNIPSHFVNLNAGASATGGKGAASVVLNAFICPSDVLPNVNGAGLAKSNYVGNTGTMQNWPNPSGSWPYGWACGSPNANFQDGVFLTSNDNNLIHAVGLKEIIDGTGSTFMVGEATIGYGTNGRINNNVPAHESYPIWAGQGGGHGPNCCLCGDLSALGACTRLCDGPFFLNRWKTDVPGGNTSQSDVSFGSQHPGGASFVMADGSVRFISDGIAMNVYMGLATRNAGEAVSPP